MHFNICEIYTYCCCSVTKLFLTLWSHELQHTRLPCPLLSPWVCSNSYPLSQWCHPNISSFVSPFSSCPQPSASGSFPMNLPFSSGGQIIEVSASASVLSMNIQGWFPLGLTDWIYLLSKGLVVQGTSSASQFESTSSFLLSLLYGPTLTSVHYWKNHSFDYMDPSWESDVSAF